MRKWVTPQKSQLLLLSAFWDVKGHMNQLVAKMTRHGTVPSTASRTVQKQSLGAPARQVSETPLALSAAMAARTSTSVRGPAADLIPIIVLAAVNCAW
eukprot:6489960-Pyramimonas_sp.AAC.1